MRSLDDRLFLDDAIEAILWDLDGVLVDSLSFDFETCNGLLGEVDGTAAEIPRDDIRAGFALGPDDFWAFLLKRSGIGLDGADRARLIERWEDLRRTTAFPLNPGIAEVLDAARAAGLRQAVVSNNPEADVRAILANAGLDGRFDAVVGNDGPGRAKKPAPDSYLHAAATLGLDPAVCAVIEDSPIGLQAATAAGARAIGVGTGGDSPAGLRATGLASVVHDSLARGTARLVPGDVLDKVLETPNDFVSHMIEHIAWRTGCAAAVRWPSDDWSALGRAVGASLADALTLAGPAAALGMIDDGSAEVLVEPDQPGGLEIVAGVTDLDLDWFLAARVEQVEDGRELVDLLRGVAEGLDARITVRVCSFEDQHHTWEGIYRGVGIALADYAPPRPAAPADDASAAAGAGKGLAESQGQGSIAVSDITDTAATCRRETSESVVEIRIDTAGSGRLGYDVQVADTIDVSAFPRLLEPFCKAAGFDLDVRCVATRLSSSHVVLEDIGLTFGRGLLGIATARMGRFGINGAGNNLAPDVFDADGRVNVGTSIEGRKFLKIVPGTRAYPIFRREFLVGRTLFGSLRSEDLDDFLDGLAGGLTCSIIAHVGAIEDPEAGWIALFEGLGRSLAMTLAPNPARRGLPAGVKASLV
ncbi:MAG: HAD-IA family hydrolase [Azospirillaceae bacterium]